MPHGPSAVDVTTQSIVVGDVERSFRVVVPHKLWTPAPVVFAFHGVGDSTESMAAYSDLDHLAADNGFLLVYPSGLNAVWAATDVDPESPDANADVQFFNALLEHIASKYNIDRRRIYLMGMSNGASFVQLIANARSSTVAAVVAHSGSRPRSLKNAEHPFPILLIVGSDDFSARSMQEDLDYYRSTGHDAELIVVDGLGHEWSTRNNSVAWRFFCGSQTCSVAWR